MKNDSVLFLFEEPWTVKGTFENRTRYLSETISHTEFEREDEQKIRDFFFKFAMDYKLIQRTPEGLALAPDSNQGSWIWMMNTMNFRSLVRPEQLNKFITSLDQLEQYPLNMFLDFHSRIGAVFDITLLNTITNRVMSSISRLPFNTEGERVVEIETWPGIHTEYPFIWIPIYLQMLLRSELKPL